MQAHATNVKANILSKRRKRLANVKNAPKINVNAAQAASAMRANVLISKNAINAANAKIRTLKKNAKSVKAEAALPPIQKAS